MPANTPPANPNGDSSGNQKVPGKPRNPKDVLPAVNVPRSKEEAAQKVEDVAKAAAVKGAAAAANSAVPGAGKAVEKFAKTKTGKKVVDYGAKVAKMYTKLIAGLLVGALVLMASMCSGGETTPLTAIGEEASALEISLKFNIPENYAQAVLDTSSEYDVPWSLLAAVAYNASKYGTRNPYGDVKQNAKKLTLVGDIFAPNTDDSDESIKGVGDLVQDLLKDSLGDIDKIDVSKTSSKSNAKTTATALAKESYDPGNVVVVYPFSKDLTAQAVKRYGGSIKALMAALGSKTTVYWLTVPGQDNGVNLNIRSASDMYSNIYVIDWSAKRLELSTDNSLEINQATADLIAEALAPVGVADDYDKTSDCPVSSPAIKPPDNDDTKGFGPLMLRPSKISDKSDLTGPAYPELQSLCFSFDLLAGAISEAAEQFADENNLAYPIELKTRTQEAQNGNPESAKYVNDFWAAVMGKVQLLGDIVGQVCEIIPQGEYERKDWVALAISNYWSCALEKEEKELHHITDVEVQDGTLSYTKSSSPVDAIVQEALDVAWLNPNQNAPEYEEYGDAIAPSRWDDSYCNPGNEYAGVFPLTKTQFTEGLADIVRTNKRNGTTFTPTGDRCNPELNIMVAANLFIKAEKVDPALRPSIYSPSIHEKMIGGWAAIGNTAKSTEEFNTIGPWKNFVCSKAPDYGNRPLLDAAQTVSTDVSIEDFLKNPELTTIPDPINTKLLEILESVRSTCEVSAANMDAELYSYIGKFTNDIIDLKEPAASYYSALGTAATLSVTRTDLYYSGSLVSRLTNLMPRQVRYDDLPETSLDSNKSLGFLLVNIARELYGGVFVNGGSSPSEAGMLGSEVELYTEFNAVGATSGVDPRLLAAIAEYGSSFDPEKNCDLRDETDTDVYFGLMYLKSKPDVCDMSAREQIELGANKLKKFYDAIKIADEEDGSIEDYRAALVLYYLYDAESTITLKSFAVAWRASKNDLVEQQKLIKAVYTKTGKDSATAEASAAAALKFVGKESEGAYQLWQNNRAIYSYAANDETIADESANCPKTYSESQIGGLNLVQRTSQGQGAAEDKFLYNLCVDSVNSALDVYAARAITYAFNNLGVVYDQTYRSRSTFDCSSFVSMAYMYAGVPMGTPASPFLTHSLLPRGSVTLVDHIRPVEGGLLKRKPGDLFFPIEGHVVMVLAHDYTISAPRDGNITYVGPFYTLDLNKINRVHGSDAQIKDHKIKLAPRRGD